MTTTTRPIQPIDLAAERASLGGAVEDAVQRVLASGAYVLGPEVEAFEREFAAYQRVKHGIGVANGTDALVLALRSYCVGKGDKVLTSPFTFFASAGAIAWCGATPTFVDVDPETALLRTDQVAGALDGVRGILPVHLYGQLCDVRALRKLADQRGVFLLEDGAQCHGAERDGVRCGELGDSAAFSFYPTKNLGAAGEGGMVVARDDNYAQTVRRMRDHGSPQKYVHEFVGTNSRLQGIQGAVLRVKLPHLDGWNKKRRSIAARYDAAFAHHDDLRTILVAPGSVPVYHQYALRVLGGRARRDGVIDKLRADGIGVAVHYPSPVHLQPAARSWGYGPGDLPGAEQLADEVVCLPVHPFLRDDEVARVCERVLAAL